VTGFTHIVSLGHRCRTTQRLREHYGFKTAFPFDWWITPLQSAVRVLRDWDLERLYDPARLSEVRRWGRTLYVEHADYRIRLQHEFPMDDARRHVLAGWREHLEAAKTRTGHLMAKFDALDRKDRRVLFVRELKAGEERRSRLLSELREAVLAHAPRAESRFLLISPSGAAAEGWIPLQIDDPTVEPWTGAPQIWDAALDGLGFRLQRPADWGLASASAAGASLCLSSRTAEGRAGTQSCLRRWPGSRLSAALRPE
jgi:hypothetical protein